MNAFVYDIRLISSGGGTFTMFGLEAANMNLSKIPSL